ncbi:MAG: GtrA family protein [Candidatus Moranbacteria bacterium]|nr:GtrA family protein [Candidatus Moranbacteria bacterium]
MWCIFKYNTSTFAHFSKYIINGVFVAIAQIIAIFVLVNYFDFSTPKLQEIANLISIEISVLVGLFLHSFITWRYKYETTRNFLKVFVYFHLVTGISFLVRAFLFPILASMNVDYMSNTLIGIAVAIVINFFGYDKLVFKRKLEDIIYKRK